MLNYCDIGTDLVPVILDSTPAKQGLYVPGTHQLILPSSALGAEPGRAASARLESRRGNLERESAFKAHGGIFLTPRLHEL